MDAGPVRSASAEAVLGLTEDAANHAPLLAAVLLIDPIAAPADSLCALPDAVNVALYEARAEGLPAISGPPVFELKAVAVGSALFDLSDGYSLTIDELQSAVFVANALTGESMLVWGAAKLELDGAEAGRFWGTTSVELGNGARITMETVVDAAIAELFRLEKLTVTHHQRAMVITGISEANLGDLAIVQSMDGETIDAATRDGLTIVADPTGSWTDEFGNAVDQAILDETAPGALYGPGEQTLSLGEISESIWRFVSQDQIESLILTIDRNRSSDDDRGPEILEIYRSLALYAADTARLASA